jgi:hypothetical protein
MVYVDQSRYAYWSVKSVAACNKGALIRLVPERGTSEQMLPLSSEEVQVLAVDRGNGAETMVMAGHLHVREGVGDLANPMLMITSSGGETKLRGWEIEGASPLGEGDIARERVGGREALGMNLRVHLSGDASASWHIIEISQLSNLRRFNFSVFVTDDCDYNRTAPLFFVGVKMIDSEGSTYRQCFSSRVSRAEVFRPIPKEYNIVEPARVGQWATGRVDVDALQSTFPLRANSLGQLRVALAFETHGSTVSGKAAESYRALFGSIEPTGITKP